MGELTQALLFLLTLNLVPVNENATLTWYGNEFLGRRHAASWHNSTPVGFPEVVTTEHRGVAAPSSLPFGTVIQLTRITNCSGHPSPLDGGKTIAIVVDRSAYHKEGWHYDGWPTTFRSLGTLEEGCLRVKVEIVR